MSGSAVDAIGGMAPFVIAAYSILWVALVGFIGLTFRRLVRLEKELAVVEAAVERRQKAQ